MLTARRTTQLARRRYQSGQLIDDKDRWCARWREDVLQPDGSVRRVRKWDVIAMKADCPTKRLAQRLLDERMRVINREDYRPAPAQTFAQFADRWMKTVMVHHKPSTQRVERIYIERHIKPAFAPLPLREISAELVQAWVSSLPLMPKTVCNIKTTFKTMWKTARAWGYVQHDPFDALRLPRFRKGNVYQFTLEEAVAIIAAARGWHRIFFRLLAETGMRPGEAAGLRPEDLDGQELHVRQSVWRGSIQTPKSVNAVRRFAISAELVADLDRHLAEAKPNKHGLIFLNQAGRPIRMDHYRENILNPILDRLGIRARVQALGIRCGNYAFRHMNATVMDSVLRTPLKTRQKRLGHANIATTLSHYTAAMDHDDLAAAEQIGALLNPRREDEALQ